MRRQSGFSLVEVTLAIGIIGFALLAIFALIPVGLNSARDSIDTTHTTLIAADVQNRVKSTVTSALFAATTNTTSTWFFTREGVYIDTATSGLTNAFYRADVVIHGTWGANAPPPNTDETVLRPVTVQLRWPLNPANGNPIGSSGTSLTFYVRKP